MCGLWAVGTRSASGGGPGGVPSPNGDPPSSSRPWAVAQPARVGSRRDDARGVDVGVHLVVVALDVHEVGGVTEARRLEQVARVGPQHRHLA